MKLSLNLDYTLGEGWLAPWVEALREGRALASSCSECGSAYFPPVRHCPNSGALSDGWQPLSGRATILFRTAGADGDFALAAFDGAQGAAIVRAERLPQDATRGSLQAIPDGQPTLILGSEVDQ